MKQDQNPTLGRKSLKDGDPQDSPPSVSLTASPEKTTEKKLTMSLALAKQKQQLQNDGKLSSHRRMAIPFKCHECNFDTSTFLPYDMSTEYGNCSACGVFQDLTAI